MGLNKVQGYPKNNFMLQWIIGCRIYYNNLWGKSQSLPVHCLRLPIRNQSGVVVCHLSFFASVRVDPDG